MGNKGIIRNMAKPQLEDIKQVNYISELYIELFSAIGHNKTIYYIE
jgi:hypothetical protein